MPKAGCAQAQAREVTQRESQSLMQNLLSISVSEILHCRGILDDDCFVEAKFAGNTLHKFKEDLDNAKAKHVERWLKEDVHDALRRKILRKMTLGVYTNELCQAKDLVESYSFHFAFDGGEIVSRLELASQSAACGVHPAQERKIRISTSHDDIKNQTQNLIRSLVSIVGTLDTLPEKHFLSFKMFYHEGVTYEHFKPAHFQPAETCPEEFNEEHEDLDMDVSLGTLNTQHNSILVSVKSAGLPDEKSTRFHPYAKAIEEETFQCSQVESCMPQPVSSSQPGKLRMSVVQEPLRQGRKRA